MNALPRALALAGGGARAAYEVGVLAAIAERASGLEFPIVTGVSAGAINAVYLAAHPGPLATAVGALRAQWSRLVVERVYRIRAGRLARGLLLGTAHTALGRGGAAAAVHGLVDMSPLREFLGANIDFTQLAANIAARRWRAAALSTTSYATGETVTFVHGPPDVPTWRRALRYAVATQLTLDHVMASAALPILFPAVRLRMLRPSRNLGALAAGCGVKLPPLVRWLVRGMGGQRATAVDFLSYLLFDPAYTNALIELGYDDVRAQWPRIERFLVATDAGEP